MDVAKACVMKGGVNKVVVKMGSECWAVHMNQDVKNRMKEMTSGRK